MRFLQMIWNWFFHRKPSTLPASIQSRISSYSRSNSSTRIVLCSPQKLEQTEDVVDLLQSGCSVLLNLERDSYDVARRLLDFVAGVAYHNENQIQRVAPRAFLITPYDAEIESVSYENQFA